MVNVVVAVLVVATQAFLYRVQLEFLEIIHLPDPEFEEQIITVTVLGYAVH